MNLEMYKCKCCGGHINRATMICEYCGTPYREENNRLIRIETFQNPVETFSARVMMDDHIMRESVELASKVALEQLSHELSKCVLPMMVVEHNFDPCLGRHEIRGTIKVVRPLKETEKIWSDGKPF